ncbi:hypothetical protein GIB67_012317 [Kingdonia uniflora]|uniref:Uncharacterized protein n=1 Tax=Kingdonia uniflora TaxID=39325 RepID=A0A7J7MVU9_9MAGN|nr:hypothetical protein GIB67_012317 [Kingdonia uniflora]
MAKKGKGKVFPESLRAQRPKVTHHKRHRELGEDDVEDVDEELTVSKWEEKAHAKAALMVELGVTDPDKASMQMKKSMYQTYAWVQAFNKVQKVAIRQLKQGTMRYECERRLEAQRYTHTRVLEAKVAEMDKVIAKQKEAFQGQLDKECKTNVRLMEFIEDLGYDPKTFQHMPMNPRYDHVADDAVRTEGAEVDVSGVGASVADGAETPVVDKVTAATLTEGVVGVDGSNPSTEGAGVIGEEETGGRDGVATPI